MTKLTWIQKMLPVHIKLLKKEIHEFREEERISNQNAQKCPQRTKGMHWTFSGQNDLDEQSEKKRELVQALPIVTDPAQGRSRFGNHDDPAEHRLQGSKPGKIGLNEY